MSVYHVSSLALADHSNETRAMVKARNVLIGLLVYLKAHPLRQEVRNLEELPSPKRIFIDAIRVLLAHEPRPEQRAQLQRVGLFLAQFQPIAGLESRGTSVSDPLSQWLEDASSVDQRWKHVFMEQERLEELFAIAGRLGRRSVPAGSVATVYVADTTTS